MDYKREELKEYFNDFLNDQDAEWIEDNQDDLHHYAFNMDYYIIGTYRAKQWLGSMVFEVIDFIKEYEETNFGEVLTDFSDPEKVINQYTYIIGLDIVSEYLGRTIKK